MYRVNAMVISLLLLSPLAAMAQSTTSRFDQRQANQERRIDQGIRSGALTAQEAALLEQGQDRLQAKENRVKADGVVTAQERARLKHAENVQSRRTYSAKHDRQTDVNHDGRIDRPHGRRP